MRNPSLSKYFVLKLLEVPTEELAIPRNEHAYLAIRAARNQDLI
jgi:hypothetical protein